MNIKKHIPNAITCGNLLCGCLAIVKTFEGDLVWAAYLVGLAVVLDFFDGFAARMLHVASPIGKDLDSLADMVTFGVVPGMIMFKLMSLSLNLVTDGPANNGWTIYPPVSSPSQTIPFLSYLKYVAFIIPIFSAIRLAKFNNDTRQTESFIGLPTPANAIFMCSLPLLFSYDHHTSINILLSNPWFLCIISVAMSFLLLAPIPLFSLKFKKFGWKGNEIRYIFLLLSVFSLVAFKFLGLAIAIVLYVALSVINNLFFKPKES